MLSYAIYISTATIYLKHMKSLLEDETYQQDTCQYPASIISTLYLNDRLAVKEKRVKLTESNYL